MDGGDHDQNLQRRAVPLYGRADTRRSADGGDEHHARTGPQVHAEQGGARCLAGGDLGQFGKARRDVRRTQPLLARRLQPPHFHPETRYITVLKGTWWVGSGPKFDKDATTPVPAGSVVVHHANQIHWDGAKDEEVIVQISGVGPSATIPVDESGRPKN